MEERIRAVVVGVAREALRESGARALILASPPDLESRLLARWLETGDLELVEPEEALVRSLAEPLRRAASEDARKRAPVEARRAAARLRAQEDGLLPVAAVNRTALLLSPTPPPEPFLPLGDVPASAVLALAGECTLPASFQALTRDGELLRAVERLLEDLRRDGDVEGSAEAVSPDLRRRLKASVTAGSWWRRVPPLVPKLGPGTWGIDLDL